MLTKIKLVSFFYKKRGDHRRRKRLLFPSPAETEFIKLMGGMVLTVRAFADPHTKFHLAFVISLGKTLRRENMRREVRVGHCFVDFGNDIKRAIEIDGNAFHMDVLAETERDNYLAERGWRVLHIPAYKVFNQPDFVREKVTAFLVN